MLTRSDAVISASRERLQVTFYGLQPSASCSRSSLGSSAEWPRRGTEPQNAPNFRSRAWRRKKIPIAGKSAAKISRKIVAGQP
jgi:hypothetical protein